jgi:hypothetical protein
VTGWVSRKALAWEKRPARIRSMTKGIEQARYIEQLFGYFAGLKSDDGIHSVIVKQDESACFQDTEIFEGAIIETNILRFV